MKKENESLSSKMFCAFGKKDKWYPEKDVKKFIKKLKDMIDTWHIDIPTKGLLLREIDKLAGKNLI